MISQNFKRNSKLLETTIILTKGFRFSLWNNRITPVLYLWMSVVVRLVVRLTDWPTPTQESLVSSVRPLLQLLRSTITGRLSSVGGSFQPSWGREGDGINKSKHLRGHELSFKKPHVTCPQTVWESGNIRHHVISMLYSLFGFQNTDWLHLLWLMHLCCIEVEVEPSPTHF